MLPDPVRSQAGVSLPRPVLRDKPWQFSLLQLLLFMGGVCLLAGAFRLFGFGVVLLVGLALIVAVVGIAIAKGRIVELLLLGSVIVVLAGWLLPPVVFSSRGPSRRSMCQHNLKQIGLALQMYHDTYNSFPPAYIADENGRPMHSWRVLLLPFLEQQNLYDLYRFDEPWDGPNNRLLVGSDTPEVYRCPSDADAADSATSYLAVVGPETIWPGAKAVSVADVKDGTSNTLIVVESHNSGIHWMEPRDLSTLQMPLSVNALHGQGLCSCHGAKESGRGSMAQFLRADGSVGSLENDTPPATLRALLTIAGREIAP
jgi:hypothetical protein